MTAFWLIVGFPLVLAAGYGSLYMGSDVLGSRRQVEKISFFLYPLLLAIPFVAAALAIRRRGLAGEVGLALPRIAGLPVAVSIALSAAAAVVLGIALFYNELKLSSWLLRLTGKTEALRRTLEGQTQEFEQRQQGTSLPVVLTVSVFIVVAEELLWRGYLLQFLRQTWGFRPLSAVLLAAASFGVNHYYFGLRNVLLKTLAAIVWTALLLWTGSLLPAVLSHYTFEWLVWKRLKR